MAPFKYLLCSFQKFDYGLLSYEFLWIYLAGLLTSWICIFMSFTKFGKFSAILFLALPSFSHLLLGFQWHECLTFCSCPTSPWNSVFFLCLFNLCYSVWIISIDLQHHWFFPLSSSCCYWNHPVFHFYYGIGSSLYHLFLSKEFHLSICFPTVWANFSENLYHSYSK